jgi:ATP adenylyltransferase
MGMNLGRSAGAGVAGHVHLHFLPRWTGDSSFMTVIGETRVQPEELSTTYRKLANFFKSD